MTHRLSISNKISCGYALTLSIAVLGTAAGFVIGDYYQQQARNQENDAQQEIHHLHRLQTSLLLARTHKQHFLVSAQNPRSLQDDYTHFLNHSAEFNQAWLALRASYNNPQKHKLKDSPTEIGAFQNLVLKYDSFIKKYFQQAEKLLKSIQQIDSPNLKPEELEAARKQLSNLDNSTLDVNVERFIDELSDLIHLAEQQYKQAKTKGMAADVIRVQIIAISILFSVAIAILLAIYTSRAIARPIQAATQVAQQVTQQENFDLQAPITTKDEVGNLATSLNQLIQRVKQLLEEQKAANESKLIQSEKMSSLGRMMAGVAHEMNNPVNCIYGNSIYVCEYVEALLALLEIYDVEIPSPPSAVQERAEEIDLDFLREDLPKLLKSIRVGAERAKQIILSLKDFSRLGETEAHDVDIHACLESTLLILNNRLKEIVVIRSYSDIPLIQGYAGLLYQVFMNLLSNAIDALEESNDEKLIAITTERKDNDWIVIKIGDNGSGIFPENQAKIFDTFFTTKPRGVGTGLGLAISRQIIVEKHGGMISCKSEIGVGTEFMLELPIKHQHPIEPSQQNYLLTITST